MMSREEGGGYVESQEKCFKCCEPIDLTKDEFEFDMQQLDYLHKKCEALQKCDYCDDYVSDVLPTPYLADATIDAKMCKGCWDMTRGIGVETEEVDIGEFVAKTTTS